MVNLEQVNFGQVRFRNVTLGNFTLAVVRLAISKLKLIIRSQNRLVQNPVIFFQESVTLKSYLAKLHSTWSHQQGNILAAAPAPDAELPSKMFCQNDRRLFLVAESQTSSFRTHLRRSYSNKGSTTTVRPRFSSNFQDCKIAV